MQRHRSIRFRIGYTICLFGMYSILLNSDTLLRSDTYCIGISVQTRIKVQTLIYWDFESPPPLTNCAVHAHRGPDESPGPAWRVPVGRRAVRVLALCTIVHPSRLGAMMMIRRRRRAQCDRTPNASSSCAICPRQTPRSRSSDLTASCRHR